MKNNKRAEERLDLRQGLKTEIPTQISYNTASWRHCLNYFLILDNKRKKYRQEYEREKLVWVVEGTISPSSGKEI